MRRTFDFLYLTFPQTHGYKRCSSDKKNPKAFSAGNDMDPGDLPPQMERMTQVEQMLIAKVAPIMRVYRLKGGQYAHGGYVVNIPQDVTGFTTSLPRLAADIPVLVVRRQWAKAKSHKHFVARRHKVYHALIWLKGNNQYYRDISIDANAACRRTAPSRGCRQGRRPQPTTTRTRTQDLDREGQREGKKSWSPFCRRQRGKLCLKTQPSSLCYAKTTGRVASALSQCHGQTWRTWRSTTSKLQASPPRHSLRCFHTARGTQLTPSAAGQ